MEWSRGLRPFRRVPSVDPLCASVELDLVENVPESMVPDRQAERFPFGAVAEQMPQRGRGAHGGHRWAAVGSAGSLFSSQDEQRSRRDQGQQLRGMPRASSRIVNGRAQVPRCVPVGGLEGQSAFARHADRDPWVKGHQVEDLFGSQRVPDGSDSIGIDLIETDECVDGPLGVKEHFGHA